MNKVFVSLATGIILASSLIGCSSSTTEDPAVDTSSETVATATADHVVIATMATEDMLPMWVSADEGLFDDNGVDAEVTSFQSAQELTTALASGTAQMAMTDPETAANLAAAGNDITIEWIALGTSADQGRFGIMTSPESGITELTDLAGKGIGVASNTIPEYVMYQLMKNAGVPEDQIITEEIPKMPVRYQMMTENQVAAAALPASLLALGEATGMTTVADDATSATNLSQSVIVANTQWAESEVGQKDLEALRTCWDSAAEEINADPSSYYDILALNANLSDAVEGSYPFPTYPMVTKISNETVDPLLDWMIMKGYVSQDIAFDEETGKFTFDA